MEKKVLSKKLIIISVAILIAVLSLSIGIFGIIKSNKKDMHSEGAEIKKITIDGTSYWRKYESAMAGTCFDYYKSEDDLNNDRSYLNIDAQETYITEPQQLKIFAYQFEDIYSSSIGSFAHTRIFLEKDIDMSGIKNMKPIGAKGKPFLGGLDGKGHSISNLKINLFGHTVATRIENLCIKDSQINADSNKISTALLIGHAENNTELENIFVYNSELSIGIDTRINDADNGAGILIAVAGCAGTEADHCNPYCKNAGSCQSEFTIKNCAVNANIKMNHNMKYDSAKGEFFDNHVCEYDPNDYECKYATTEWEKSEHNDNTKAPKNIGGYIGNNRAKTTFTDCYFIGEFYIYVDDRLRFGGLAGGGNFVSCGNRTHDTNYACCRHLGEVTVKNCYVAITDGRIIGWCDSEAYATEPFTYFYFSAIFPGKNYGNVKVGETTYSSRSSYSGNKFRISKKMKYYIKKSSGVNYTLTYKGDVIGKDDSGNYKFIPTAYYNVESRAHGGDLIAYKMWGNEYLKENINLWDWGHENIFNVFDE